MKKMKVLKEVQEVYERQGMRSFEELLKKYQEGSVERQCLNKAQEYLQKRNSNPNTRVFGIDDFIIKEILD